MIGETSDIMRTEMAPDSTQAPETSVEPEAPAPRPPLMGVGSSARPTKTAEIVARQIVSAITRKRMAPGDRLPSEAEMLAELGVGRATLREALRYLELQGVLVIRPGAKGGPTVAPPDARGIAASLSLVLQANRTPFRTIVRSRTLLEPLVAAEAAANAKETGYLDELRESVEKIEQSNGDVAAFLAENGRFHELVAWASGNVVFAYLIGSLHWIIDGSALGVQYPEWAQPPTIKAHRKIYEAIKAGDQGRASREMEKHNKSFEGYLNDYYPQVLDQIVHWGQPGA
jgi:GntR family transcriptional regulator, transcriptional repressor for pyruvate dehydrogenase complex